MDGKEIDSEYYRLEKKGELLDYLQKEIDELERALGDDRLFFSKELEAATGYLRLVQAKFQNKIQQCQTQLAELEQQNETTSVANQNQYDEESYKINELFSSGQHYDAYKKLYEYKRNFHHRPTIIQCIPKFTITDSDIDRLFSPEAKPTEPLPAVIITATPVVTSTITVEDDDTKENCVTGKELRKQKVVETVVINRDDRNIDDNSGENAAKHDADSLAFGIRSRRPQNTPMPGNTTQSPTPTRRYRLSTRLPPATSNNALPVPISRKSPPSIPISLNSELARSTPTPPQSSVHHSGALTQENPFQKLKLNTISLYECKRQMFLLMACNPRYIIIFESQINRHDCWQLGLIERGSGNQCYLDWHDGLIISMGYIKYNRIYIFTQREFIIYDLADRRKVDARILPSGNDDELEHTGHPYENAQRGIGTIHKTYMYHLYTNRKSHWTLSKSVLERKAHVVDYNLTLKLPDVQYFLHVDVNDQSINFLVQLTDLSYAVAFCSLKDCSQIESMPLIRLSNAKQPLRLSSAFIEHWNRYVFFINDPSAEILHILDGEHYLESYRILPHAISYTPDNHQLLIVTNKSICSMNLEGLCC